MERYYYVYMLASGPQGTLYVGVTNHLVRRVAEHREKVVSSFTSRYDVLRLVWFETHTSIDAAILREKQIKRWKRQWKLELFTQGNPHWEDLYPGLTKGIWT